MKTDWNKAGLLLLPMRTSLLAHSNYEDGLKHLSSINFESIKDAFGAFQLWRRIETHAVVAVTLCVFLTFGAFQLWRRIETSKTHRHIMSTVNFWRIPIMKTDWNRQRCHLIERGCQTFGAFQLWRRIETGYAFKDWFRFWRFWRIPIMKTDWNKRKAQITTGGVMAFGAFQLWRRIETIMSCTFLSSFRTFGAFQLWRRIETSQFGLMVIHDNAFGAFQLWRRIETHKKLLWNDSLRHFWRIPIMKTDWNLSPCLFGHRSKRLLAHSNYEDGLKLMNLRQIQDTPNTFGAFQLWRRIETIITW